MKTVRLWFNRWFSTAYHIINLIKQDKDINFYIIGSSSNPYSLVKEACDEWYSEPDDLSDKEYADFCIDFCRTHQIDIFIPRHNQLSVSEYKKEFEKAGILLLADDYELISGLQNKASAYELFKNSNIGFVPEYYTVKSSLELPEAFSCLSKRYSKVCCKFTHDEGGCSFRIIDTEPPAPFKRAGNHVTLEKLSSDIDSCGNKCPEIMLMPVLSGNEVSADCLRTSAGNIIIPRFKTDTRLEYIKYDKKIMTICSDFLDLVPLECPCNIQFRYLDGTPYFLEVNTRMSGGIQMTCLASGINIPMIAVNKLLGIQKSWMQNFREVKVTHIETPIIIK